MNDDSWFYICAAAVLITFIVCDTYLYSKGHETLLWSHKTAEEKAIQQKQIEVKCNDSKN